MMTMKVCKFVNKTEVMRSVMQLDSTIVVDDNSVFLKQPGVEDKLVVDIKDILSIALNREDECVMAIYRDDDAEYSVEVYGEWTKRSQAYYSIEDRMIKMARGR